MQPLAMNEYIQQNLADVGIKVDFDVVEWNTMINLWRAGAKADTVKGANGINFSYFIQDPFTAFVRHIDSKLVAPNGTNWGYYQEPAMDALLEQARTTFDAGGAGQGAAEDAREDRRRGAVPVRDARRRATRHVDQGDRLRPGPELVPGLLADHDEVGFHAFPRLRGKVPEGRKGACPQQGG